MNVQPKINRLLTALRTKGVVYKINTQQFYSKEQERICTKMVLWEVSPNKDGEVFYSKVKMLQYLVDKWKEVSGDGKDQDGRINRADE